MFQKLLTLLFFIVLTASVKSQNKVNEMLIDSLVELISKEQILEKKDFYPGMIYSYRGLAAPPYNYQPDNNIFFSAISAFTLRNLKVRLKQKNQNTIDSVIAKIAANYPRFQNKKKLPYYNFWPTGAPIMPNSLFFKYLSAIFSQGEDADDSVMILMTSKTTDSINAILKNRINELSNLGSANRKIKSTLKRYKKIPAYSTYLGGKMPVDFDFAVQCNLLYFTYDQNLPFSEQDKGTIQLISKMVEDRLYMKRPTYIAPYYVESSILLYHLTRLMSAFHPAELEIYKTQLISDLQYLQAKRKNIMEKILISTSLMRLGAESPELNLNSIQNFKNSNQEKFVFFQARPAFWYPSPLKQIFLHVPYLNYHFYAPTFNKILWLENLALQNKMHF